jgi:SAM-dependent methyltransferase
MAHTQKISRREIKQFIRTYAHRTDDKGWYQNIRFLPFLETRRNAFEIVLGHLRGHIRKEDLLISNIPRLEGKRVLDIGCNAGMYSLEASCRGASFVLGVDQEPFRIKQANEVADVYRRLGRPVGTVEFRLLDDINNHLDLLADKDVLIASCVLYHLGPLARLKAAISASNIRLMILQGNMARYNSLSRPGARLRKRDGGEDVSSLDGICQFAKGLGFTPTVAIEHASPLVVASR